MDVLIFGLDYKPMRRTPLSMIASLILLALLVGGLGWSIYAPVRQEKLNRALIVAIKKNDTKQALAALAEGADPNTRDEFPQHLSLWRMLLDRLRGKRPASPAAPTALLLACSCVTENQTLLVRTLLDRGAAVETPDNRQWTSLLYTTSNGYIDVSILLIERGANLNAADMDGHTPLMYAEVNHCEGLVRLLISKGANVNIKAINDETPLKLAKECGDKQIIQMLKQAGAKE